MLNEEGPAVLRRNTLLPPLPEYHISAFGQFPLILVSPCLLARRVTSGLVFSCACIDQRLGGLTKGGYLRSGYGMIGLSRGGEHCSLFQRQRLNYSSKNLPNLFGYLYRDRLYIFGR